MTKRGFTLVEMLIVVAIIVTMMAFVFHIGSVGSDSSKRSATVSKIQRLENALSGYYAAFGTYPPVKLHGSRNPYLKVDVHGIQEEGGQENVSIWGWSSIGEESEKNAWEQVKAACLSQPVACMFPYPQGFKDVIRETSEGVKSLCEDDEFAKGLSSRRLATLQAGFDDGVSDNLGRHDKSAVEWRELQLFKFGVMSFLLPRYLVMLSCSQSMRLEAFAQWDGNNVLPSDPMNGRQFSSWQAMREQYVFSNRSSDHAHVANIPSQAVCARWMPNFERSLACTHTWKLFGVRVDEPNSGGGDVNPVQAILEGISSIEIFAPNANSTGNQYLLDSITMKDGWGNDIYYYSPAPYQGYKVWSAGANGRTFPPWISRDGLTAKANSCVALWVKDDIAGLGN